LADDNLEVDNTDLLQLDNEHSVQSALQE